MGKRSGKNAKYRKKSGQAPKSKRLFIKNNREMGFSSTNRPQVIVKDSLREDQVGITEYIKSGKGFNGILKSRFSDFHVNEIDLTGRVLQLNDLNIPEQKEDELSEEELVLLKQELSNVISEVVWKQIIDLKEAKHDNNKNPKDSAIYINVTVLDKEQRTKVHRVIKKMCANKLVSSTVSGEEAGKEGGERFIQVMKSKGRDRNRWTFPGEYVHFLVHKENLDTSEVVSAISRKLSLKPSQVSYCGTKDRRAITTQKFCIRKRTPREIYGTVQYMKGVTIGNYMFKDNVLKLGDLRGNRFRIALRNLAGERQHIETLLHVVKNQGFINYFGLQRFGNCSAIPTYEVGVALLKADYKLACELILKPRSNDSPFLKSIREMWWKNRDSKAAAAQFYGDRYIEKKLLDGLAQYGENDYAAALKKIPYNMLLLYPHAFQSLIFNNIASKRIKEFGLSLIPGDIVYQDKNDTDFDMESAEFLNQDDNEKLQENEVLSLENTKDYRSAFRRNVKLLTEEDISSAAYTIYDMVLPLPGYDVTYPENITGSWYKDMLEEYGLSSEKLKHNVKMFAMAGAYRRLVVRPKDMTWEFKTYSTPEEILILSDLELLNGKKLEDFESKSSDPKYEALLLNFCLPPAAYATMMLRELLKYDTSTSAQSLLKQAAEMEHSVVDKMEQETQNVESICGKRKINDTKDNEVSSQPVKVVKSNDRTEQN